MRKLVLCIVCLVAMIAAGTSLKAQEVTIVLNPGWTWISYPSTDTVDIATAFGSFTPAIGDIFKSKWGMATCIGNGQWRGAISPVFYPGYGYHYKSNRTMPVVLTINVQQPAPQVVVTTSEPLMITAISAMCGGEVTVNDGTYIFAKGLCWATHENPTTNDDFYQEAESGVGSFSLSMTGLNISTTYYVRAYAVTGNGTVYGDQKTFTTRDGIPTLTTDSVMDITGVAATCGGDITDNGGLNVTVRGVCWSTSPNPTIADSHTTDGTGLGSFVSAITDLTPNTTYYVRAYATNSYVTVYGNQQSFMTESGGSGVDHDYVDLGLPSGTLWATCNVGANAPENYGDYFAWGETQPKDYYDWSTYQYSNGGFYDEYGFHPYLTKYCNNSEYGYNGYTDNLTILLPEDDAATANWGSDWRMPTEEEFQELYNNTTVTRTTQNGVNGGLFTASNGNSLFLPAAGFRNGTSFNGVGTNGYYWSSSLSTDDSPKFAMYFGIYSDNSYGMGHNNGGRNCGRPVRAVLSMSQNSVPTGAINGKFTINDNGDQVYFSQGNLQYQASTNTWRFAENQWDYIGNANSNVSSTYDGWIDLFGWGTSGYNHGAVCYQPWSTSPDETDYYAYGNYQYNLNDQTSKADWGYNAISNGGNQENLWHTFTQS